MKNTKKENRKDSVKVKVVCRFRPLNSLEIEKGGPINLTIEDNDVTVRKKNHKDYTNFFSFDKIYDSKVNQREIYETAARDVVESIFQGYNGTLIAYGQTASGKTYTMEGKRGKESLKGMIPRAVKNIFHFITESPEYIEFTVKVSILEIYMEELKDLLASDFKTKESLKIRTHSTKGVYIEHLTGIYVSSPEEVDGLLKIGKKNRHTGRTNMNLVSSRSHLLVYIELHQNDTKEDIGKTAKLLLVDLAGSEKVSKTGSEGQTLKEAKQINQSLLYLGNVINALNERQFVPYRNSQLTRLLEQSLGGNSKTTLIINCSLAEFNYSETLSTLRFGTRAQLVQNKPKENREFTPEQLMAIVEKLQDKNIKLNKRVEILQAFIKDKVKKEDQYDLELELTEKMVSRTDLITDTINNQNQEWENLMKEMKALKENCERLKLKNAKLKKIVNGRSKRNINFSLEDLNDSVNESPSQVLEVLSPLETKKFFTNLLKTKEDENMSETFGKEMNKMNLGQEIQHKLMLIFKTVEDKNFALTKKIFDMRTMMAELLIHFKSIVSVDYKDFQRLHKEIVSKEVDEWKQRNALNNGEIVNLLSIYYLDNKRLNIEIRDMKKLFEEKENFWKLEKKKFMELILDHQSKMKRLLRILNKKMKKNDSGLSEIAFANLNGNIHLDWKKFEKVLVKKNSVQMKDSDSDEDEEEIEPSSEYRRNSRVIKKIRGGQ